MNLSKILQILESLLGKSKKQSKGEYIFFCTVCHHYKPKLIVKLDPSYKSFQSWHCWVCQETNNTKGKSLFTLFKHFNASENQFKELKDALGERSYDYVKKDETKKIIRLPKEFIPLWDNGKKTIERRHALVELTRRRITEEDIIRYHIGYCEDGEYAHRIIVPSFDANGLLNYFVARSYFKDTPLKYKNPQISKNIIMFDFLINWNLNVVLCEGVFDAIAIRRNAIPLLGKTLPDILTEKIISFKPPSIFIALDDDAIRDSVKIAELLTKEQIENYIVKLGAKDPSDLGFKGMLDVIKNELVPINENSLFKMKLKYGV